MESCLKGTLMRAQNIPDSRTPQSANWNIGTGGYAHPDQPPVSCVTVEKGSMSLAFGVALAALGTGGMLDCSLAKSTFAQPTGTSRIFQWAPKEQDEANEPDSLRHLLSDIRAAFGFNVSQLAAVLKVQRQTIYLWLDSDEQPRIQLRNRERLTTIHTLARSWNGLSLRPAEKWLDHAAPGHESLLALMSKDYVDTGAVHALMRTVASLANEDLSARRSKSIAEKLREKGFVAPPVDVVRGTLARYTDTVTSWEE